MKIIKNILLVVDGEYHKESLIAEVVTLAKDSSAHVTLLCVFDAPAAGQENATESSELQQWLEEDYLEKMQEISSELVNNGIEVSIKQASGKPYIEIIREALRGNYDLIMKPAESESGLKNRLFGSMDMQLFRMCPDPVWAFKPTTNTDLRKIMIAVDLEPSDQEKSDLADKVLQWGKHVADLVDAEIHLTHIWSLYGEARLRGRSVMRDQVDKLVLKEQQKHQQWLQDLLAKNGLQQEDVRLHFHKGEAKELIPVIARNIEADLLVIGTVGRTGIPGFFIGNTADSVLRQINCSVLAIKPEGFLSPVQED